jgi:hypothetical protein
MSKNIHKFQKLNSESEKARGPNPNLNLILILLCLAVEGAEGCKTGIRFPTAFSPVGTGRVLSQEVRLPEREADH